MKTNGHSTPKTTKAPAFVIRAERAFRRVARRVRAEHTKLDLPIIGGDKGKARVTLAR